MSLIPHQLLIQKASCLKMRDPRVVKRSLDRLDKKFEKEDVYSRMDTLRHYTIDPLPDNLQL